jgi:hypothetical protein
MTVLRGAIALLALALPVAAAIQWDPSTLVLVQPNGVYGRMARLTDGEIICSYERAGRVWVRRSNDEGRTWTAETQAASFAYGNAANPELLVLPNGWVLLFYNERPTDRVHPFTIQVAISRDNAQTWDDHRLLYEAGTDSGTGCWEPAAVLLPTGEIQLFFANEKPYPDTTEQEITLLRSYDLGETWSEPARVSFRAGRRDGMPVPLLLSDGRGVALAIEDNGLAGAFKPAIVYSSIEDNWTQPFAGGDSPRRWAALDPQLPDPVYAGAPYLRQFPSGETVLSLQSGEDRDRQSTLDFSRMVVYVGDAAASHFGSPSVPFPVAPGASGLWNSLFIKNETTVTAISGTVIDGVRGLWAIDGTVGNAP